MHALSWTTTSSNSLREKLRSPRFCVSLFLSCLFITHAVVIALYGHLRPERMRIRGIDPVAYYAYFHSLYFDHDLDFANQYQLLGEGFLVPARTATGKTGTAHSIGPAIALAPFWIAADAVARLGGWKADGTSAPYHVAAFVGLAFYGLLALLALGAWTTRHFGPWAGAGGAAVAWGAGTLVYSCFPLTLMPHAIGAAASTIFLLVADIAFGGTFGGTFGVPPLGGSLGFSPLVKPKPNDPPKDGTPNDPNDPPEGGTPNERRRYQRRWAIFAGLALGVAMLMRWQNALFVIYPVVLSVKQYMCVVARQRQAFSATSPMASPRFVHFQFLISHFSFYILFFLSAAVAFSPQTIAWQIIFGWPLGVPREGLTRYLRPEILNVLFSMRSGLFTWTPAMACGVAGLFLAGRARRWEAGALATIFLAQLYVNSAVPDWTGDWDFGARRFTECAPIFAFGWAALLAFRRPSHSGRAASSAQDALSGSAGVSPAASIQPLENAGGTPALPGSRRARIRYDTAALGALLIVWNELFIFQYTLHLISWDRPLTVHELIGDKFHLRKSYQRRFLIQGCLNWNKAGNNQKAWECIKQAMEIDPCHDDVYEVAGKLSMSEGGYKKAVEYFDRGLRINPGHPRIIELRSQAETQE